MNNQEFYRWYRRLIEDPPQAPPGHIWENISLELDREFCDWYRSKVEESGEEPPEAVWAGISQALDSQGEISEERDQDADAPLYQHYRAAVENPPEEPSGQVWENIQEELDIDDTWYRISQRLDQSWKIRTRRLVYALAAVALLFFALEIFLPSTQKHPANTITTGQMAQEGSGETTPERQRESAGQAERQQQESQDEQPSPGREKAGRPQQASPSKEAEKQKQLAVVREEPEEKPASRSADASKPGGKEQQAPPPAKTEPDPSSSNLLARAEPVPATLETDRQELLASMPSSATPSFSEQEEQETSTSTPARFYAGMTGEMGNSWLLSDKTIHSIRKSPYSSASPETGNSYGIIAGMPLSERFDVQLEALITSETGQKYREYINGQVTHNQIQLNYSTLNMAARYKVIRSSFNLPLSHHLVLGAYGSYLKNARQLTNGEEENIRGAYKNYNLGLLMGYEISTPIATSYTLSAGVRLNPGFINIYDGTRSLPARFNKTYSTTFSLHLSLKYNFSLR